MLFKIFVAVMAFVLISPLAVASAETTEAKELKPVALADGFALGGIEGTFSRDDEDNIRFCPAQTLIDNVGSIEKGRCIEVLTAGGAYAAIETLLDTQKTARLKVWGLITEFNKDNYAYISFAVPLVGEKQPPEQQETNEQEQAAEEPDDSLDEPIIPDDILSILSSGASSIDTTKILAFEELTKDKILADKTGIFRFDAQNRIFFVPDGLGRNIQNERYYLVNSKQLERLLPKLDNSSLVMRFNIAAIASEYDGTKYLLLQRANRSYNYGNLSQF